MSDLKFTTAADYMTDSTSFVIALGNQLDEMRERGEKDTEEYKVLLEEWEALAHDLVLADILVDENYV